MLYFLSLLSLNYQDPYKQNEVYIDSIKTLKEHPDYPGYFAIVTVILVAMGVRLAVMAFEDLNFSSLSLELLFFAIVFLTMPFAIAAL